MNDTPNNKPDANTPGSDDPTLTAFALGELAPGSDVYEQVQERLKIDADARAYVEQTRTLGEQLSASYRTNDSASAGLSKHQQKELAAMIDQQDNTNTDPIKPPMRTWLSRPALIAAGLALAAGAAITTIAIMNGPDTPTTQHVDAAAITGLPQIGESLAEPVAVDFENAPLSEVFAFLNKQTRVKIDTDWDALAKRGIDAKTPVTLKADELVPAGNVLSAALQAAWSQSQHPDPAQWTMTDEGITVAPQSALVQARLDATAALLANDRLSKGPLDTRVLSADRAEVWESDLWNRVLAQRSAAADAVLAEADAAFDAAETATGEEDFDRAASKAMYAYHLIGANSTLLAADQFDEPAERFETLRDKITKGKRAEHEAALAEALEEAKKRYAEFGSEENKDRLALAEAQFKTAEELQKHGNLQAATQHFEDAALLDPANDKYLEGLQQVTRELDKTIQPLSNFDGRGRAVALDRLEDMERKLGTIDAKLEKGAVANKPMAPAPGYQSLTEAQFSIGQYGGQSKQKRSNNVANASLFGSGGNANGSLFRGGGNQQGQAWAATGASAPAVTSRLNAGKEANQFFSLEQSAGERGVRKQAESLAMMSDQLVELKKSISDTRESLGRYKDDYRRGEFDRVTTDEEGKIVSRRAALQAQRDKLVEERPLPELEPEIKAQYDTITIALNDAKQLEPFELKRLEAIKDLEELNKRFHDECGDVFDFDPVLSRDAFAMVNDNPFYNPADAGRAMSTFSVDVDTAAYTIARRKLMQRNQLPVPGAVRIEEMINYFDYGYEAPTIDPAALEDGVVTQTSLEAYEKKNEGFAPFATHIQVTDCPWQEGNQLVRIGIKGMEVAQEDRPAAHLTFLLDVSGSMKSANKLPLVRETIKLLLDKLNDKDRVSIVVYAGSTEVKLENAATANRADIEAVLDKLNAKGGTSGAKGIQLAYDVAKKHYIDGGVNRVILCTDGDYNIGVTDTGDLVDLIKAEANPAADDDGNVRGVYLSVMGYGMGNLNDAMMEPLSNAGNGTYAYIDTLKEATKVMYDQAGSNLVTIAKDVKVQVHFDADQVMAYRLIGYENRVLANEDFDNDKVDAGDIGAGHSVTALYEVVPFPTQDELNGNEGFFEVRHRIDELERAVTLNQTLMQTASLSAKQSMKLAASTRMLEQEIMLANAVAVKIEGEADAKKPANVEVDAGAAAPGDIAHEAANDEHFDDGAMLAVKLRYKPVDAPAEDGTSRLITSRVFADELIPFAVADESTRFAASVASFAMQLRSSPHAGAADLDWVLDTAKSASDHDPSQLRAEMLELVKKAKGLMPEKVIEEAPGQENLVR